MYIQRTPADIFAQTYVKTLFSSAAFANRTLMALIYTNEKYCILTLYQTTNFRLFQSERACRRQFYC